MAPLTERDINTPTTTPLSAKLTMSQIRANDENATPQSITSKLPSASRLVSHTKSSAARIATMITPQGGTPSSKLPRLTRTPTDQPSSNGKPRVWSQTVGKRASATRLYASPRPALRAPSSADTVTIYSHSQVSAGSRSYHTPLSVCARATQHLQAAVGKSAIGLRA